MTPDLREAVAKYFDDLASYAAMRAARAHAHGILLERWSHVANEASKAAMELRA